MRSLVVLFAVVAMAAAKPSHSHVAYAAAPVAYAAPVYAAPSAVSHQSRVDVHSSPAVVTSYSAPAYAAPVAYAASPVAYSAPLAYSAPVAYAAAPVSTNYVGGSAVTHQERVDVETSPAVVEEHVVSPVVEARSAWAPSVYASTW